MNLFNSSLECNFFSKSQKNKIYSEIFNIIIDNKNKIKQKSKSKKVNIKLF